MRFILQFLIIILLTIISQIGGLIYLIVILTISSKKAKFKIKQFLLFCFLYIASTYVIVPHIAPKFGREKISQNSNLSSHFFLTDLLNRNYVKPELNYILVDISKVFKVEYSNIKIQYLDANFPFWDGFPLLPHLSHNDGKKIDISFLYEDEKGNTTNLKPSTSGYGVFVEPNKNSTNQTEICKTKGYWQYDFPKYLTFGSFNKNIRLSEKATKNLILEILKHKNVSKVFIEPHLKNRLKINNNRIRFHGCKAVRHDDHIHFQIN